MGSFAFWRQLGNAGSKPTWAMANRSPIEGKGQLGLTIATGTHRGMPPPASKTLMLEFSTSHLDRPCRVGPLIPFPLGEVLSWSPQRGCKLCDFLKGVSWEGKCVCQEIRGAEWAWLRIPEPVRKSRGLKSSWESRHLGHWEESRLGFSALLVEHCDSHLECPNLR